VGPDKLRFDFAHFETTTTEQLTRVEDMVNALVLHNVSGDIEQMNIDDARKKGAMALFGEKYGDRVRVVGFGPSIELCGGIHVHRTGDIGLVKITAEGPLAAGVRRIEAVTGLGALAWARHQSELLQEVARSMRISIDDVPARVEKLASDLRDANKEIERSKQKAQTAAAGNAMAQTHDVNGIKVLALKVTDVEAKGLRDYADKLRDQLKSGVVVLGVPQDDNKCTLLVALTADLTGRFHAGKIVGELAALVGGKGGGKPDLAQAGGTDATHLDAALAKIDEILAR
jgi:alanyl-tRNA synthetase